MDALGLTQSTTELEELLDPVLCPLYETKNRLLTEPKLQRRLEVARELIAKRKEVERLILAGCTRAEMAQVLGLKATTVLGYACDVLYQKYYPALSGEIKKLRKLYAEARTDAEIAQACGCEKTALTVWRWYQDNKRGARK